MYTTKPILILSSDPISSPPTSEFATITGNDGKKVILLESESGTNCDGTYNLWAYSSQASKWYLFEHFTLSSTSFKNVAYVPDDKIGVFDKIALQKTGTCDPTHWRVIFGTNMGGF